VNSRLRSCAILVPALNEAEDLPATLESLPRELAGISSVAIIVVDDGSTDGTAEVAQRHGADVVVRHGVNRGLARAWSTGVAEALRIGADVIVHTDADGQYDARDIPALVAPILAGRADLVVGARPVADLEHFSGAKRLFQRLGSWAVRIASGTQVPDAPSGFRAMNAHAARQLTVTNGFTYTLETLIQAGRSGLRVTHVPVRVTGPTRPSRLMASWPRYVWRSAFTILRLAVVYRPFRFFASVGAVLLLIGSGLIGRFLINFLAGQGQGNVQSLIIAGMLVTLSVQAFMTAFLADAISANRRVTERLVGLVLREDDGLRRHVRSHDERSGDAEA